MPTYCYECDLCGYFEAEQSIYDQPLQVHGCGKPCKKVIPPVQFLYPETHSAMRDTSEWAHRHYRQNKEAAEGLANGTMMPPSDRGVFGDEQSRESKAQFNRMYDEAKGRTSPQR